MYVEPVLAFHEDSACSVCCMVLQKWCRWALLSTIGLCQQKMEPWVVLQVFRREMLGEELLIDMEFAWTGSQKFQLQVWPSGAAWFHPRTLRPLHITRHMLLLLAVAPW